METLLSIHDIYSIKQGSELPCKCRTTGINRWENLKHRFYHFTLTVNMSANGTHTLLRTRMDIYDPSTIHALITTAGDQDQQEDRCQHCLLSECVTVCVWTEGWCRVGHIVTMALFLVTTQRNNSSFPPHHHHHHHHRQSTSGCVSTAPTPKQIIPQSTFFK